MEVDLEFSAEFVLALNAGFLFFRVFLKAGTGIRRTICNNAVRCLASFC
jgi:hypothetical protein